MDVISKQYSGRLWCFNECTSGPKVQQENIPHPITQPGEWWCNGVFIEQLCHLKLLTGLESDLCDIIIHSCHPQ